MNLKTETIFIHSPIFFLRGLYVPDTVLDSRDTAIGFLTLVIPFCKSFKSFCFNKHLSLKFGAINYIKEKKASEGWFLRIYNFNNKGVY